MTADHIAPIGSRAEFLDAVRSRLRAAPSEPARARSCSSIRTSPTGRSTSAR